MRTSILLLCVCASAAACKRESDYASVEFFANGTGCTIECSGSDIGTVTIVSAGDFYRKEAVEVGSSVRLSVTPKEFLSNRTRPAYIKVNGFVKAFEAASTPDSSTFVPAVIEMRVPELNRYGEEI